VLAAVDRDLVRAIDFGMFAWLVVPLLRALKWINLYVGNYGWSLIILTILINLAMFPLRHKSVVSMRKMQDVQPEVKAIQERYKGMKMSDPGRAKMNQEMMELYKAKGVNPASGCVPMLLTLPGAVRVLLDAVGRHRAARRAVHPAGPRPLGARSVVRLAGPHGRDDVHPAEDDADDGGSRAAEDDAVHCRSSWARCSCGRRAAS
jgi:hypothetical protein